MIILETARLLFREHEESDLEFYCEMMSDPEFRRLSGGDPLSREEAEKSFQSIHAGQKDRRQMKAMTLLATVLKPEGHYIGRCGLYPHRDDDNNVIPGEGTLAFYIARPYWGRGLATEAGQAFIQYGFKELGLIRIVAGANTENAASNRVLKKLGFIVVRSGGNGDNKWHDYEFRNI